MGNILENNGCGGITGNFVTGQAKARTILHEWVGQQSEYHSVYFIKVLSSLKKTPCELDPPQNADTECFLIRSERTITVRGLEESATQLIGALSTAIVARGATTGRM